MKNILQLEKDLFITKECQKNQIIFKEDERCNYVGFVINGEFVISSYSFNGNEIVYAHLSPSSVFGNNLIFSTTPFYKGNVICVKNGTIKLISKENLIKLLIKYPSFLEEYLKYSSLEILKLNQQVKILSFDDAMERLIYFLKENNNQYHYQSITSLSRLLGLRRETLSRLITSLINKNIITKANKTIILK